MKYPKPKRVGNKKAYKAYKEFIREQPCVICGNLADPHHVKTRGAHGDNYYLIPICRPHHSQLHSKGQARFARDYNLDINHIVVGSLVDFIEEYYG